MGYLKAGREMGVIVITWIPHRHCLWFSSPSSFMATLLELFIAYKLLAWFVGLILLIGIVFGIRALMRRP